MKELSIEEKAKRYDEAIEIAREINNEQRVQPYNIMTRVFPELIESEDERIRKEIIQWLKNSEGQIYPIDRYNAAIAWLEKQGEQKSVDNVEPKFKVKYAGREYNVLEFREICGIIYYGIEDAPNHFKYVKADDCAIISGYDIKENGSPCPTKPADKVEPKFQVGDFVVDTCGSVWKIEGIINQFYILEGIDGGESRPTIDWVDTTYHLWDSTKYAKDGDVLASGEVVFMFKMIHGIWLRCHCSAHKDGSFNADSYDLLTNKYFGEVYPATKEQRNFLFQKMHEAGYEWDAELKQLKKIEQKPDTDFSDIRTWEYIVDAVLTEKEGIGQYLDSPFTEEVAKKLQKRFGNIEQNHAWSYEDEANLNNIIWLCNNCIKGSETTWIPSQATKIKRLIETIKEKGLAQQTSAWSEEDEKRIANILSVLSVQVCWEGAIGKKMNPYQKEIDWLKSLEDRYPWKPSEEQMEALEHFIRSIGESGFASPYDSNTKLVYSLFNDLKKLK